MVTDEESMIEGYEYTGLLVEVDANIKGVVALEDMDMACAELTVEME